MSQVIHQTVGVYADGSMEVNGVSAQRLQMHIEYNKFWRPGRALFVDGVCVYVGSVDPETIASAVARIKRLSLPLEDTMPYQ